VAAPMRKLVALVGEYPDGIAEADLVVAARARFGAAPTRILALVKEALGAQLLERAGVNIRVHSAEIASSPGEPSSAKEDAHGLRLVLLDVESIVKATATEPFTDKRIFQIGAVRSGSDSAWVQTATEFERFQPCPTTVGRSALRGREHDMRTRPYRRATH
jgi:hypothetical protein